MKYSNTGTSTETDLSPTLHPSSSLSSLSPAIARALSRVDADECPADPDREALYEQFQPLVRSLLRKYGRTPELRQDLPGEIYYQFCRLVEAYQPARGIPICAYLHRMLTQTMFNYVRDHWRKEARFVPLPETLEDAGDGGAEARSWDEAIISQDFRSLLPGAIATLPHRQRLVLVWRYYDGRSFEEIAGQLQVKPATARSLLRHAIAALRNRFAGER